MRLVKIVLVFVLSIAANPSARGTRDCWHPAPGHPAPGTAPGTLSAQAPAAPQPTATKSAKIWQGRNAEFEEFLRTAPFVKVSDVPIGVTRPKRGYFAPGGLVESAAWKLLPPGRPNGYWESYKSEIAAYELDKLLGMDMVPPSVEKRVDGDRGAAILWVKPVRAMEGSREPAQAGQVEQTGGSHEDVRQPDPQPRPQRRQFDRGR